MRFKFAKLFISAWWFFCVAASAADRMDTATIGIGQFEFPIRGSFAVEREGGATVLTTSDGRRRLTLAMFDGANGQTRKGPDSFAKLEALLKRNWQSFATSEKMALARAFKRTTLSSGITQFSMASETTVGGSVQHYVQFAVADSKGVAMLFVEGFGPAAPTLSEIEPLVAQVKVVERAP